ncbi:MAG: selenide, water dikinase SelD [Phycisphaerae bacterium]|nr:selenide, water dikinase SelD [Phycisphaerae bacterium]
MRNAEKRKRVMARSMRLGHCVCNPKQPCPCDTLRDLNVCPCAGERLEGPAEKTVRLTQMVEKAGCASKIDQAALRSVLQGLPEITDPNVLVGMPAADDAGVYRLDDEHALVQTVDVFTPSVDDPYTFGQIAAANSVSDVYAMGGRPISALSIVGFPIREAPDAVLHEILRGGIDKMAQAGVAVIGGHSINDKESKAGFAVTGLIHPARIVSNAGARPGDVLVLTKPIGTGIIAFAAQIGRAPADAVDAIAASMASLNKPACELMLEFDAHACTDVTGFGLMGHLTAMASASGVDIDVIWDDIPLFDGVIECVVQEILPGAIERNRESVAGRVALADGVPPVALDVCCDAQTSGGLLIAVAQDRAEAFLTALHERGVPKAAALGKVVSSGEGRVTLRTRGERVMPQTAETSPATADKTPSADEPCCASEESTQMACCENGHDAGDAAPGGPAELQQMFQQFMKAAGAPGALDATTKQAIAVALSALAKCEPCLKAHIKKARQMGFTQDEIDEAAWLAVSFGGCSVMMFYNTYRRTGAE